jgi:hypothetical protein
MLDFDDRLREIADFASPEKKGELLQILKELKKDIIKETLHKVSQGFTATVNNIEVYHLDKGLVNKEENGESN